MTHCFDLLKELMQRWPELRRVQTHYNVDGVEAVVVHPFDRQKYRIRIEPVQEKSRVQEAEDELDDSWNADLLADQWLIENRESD